MRPGRPALSLKGRALRYLSQREHSRAELERKLRPHEEAPGDIARVLDELAQRGFIDHGRVAESVIYRRAGKLGAMRLRQELLAKGLEDEVVAEAMAGLKGTEVARAREVWQRRFGERPQDATERARQVRFLAARGFEGEVIRKVIRGLED